MPQYQWVTQSRNGSAINDVGVALQNRRISYQLNRPCTASASIRVNDVRTRRDTLGGLQPGVHEMKIYRDGTPQETVFQLTGASPSFDENTGTIQFEWQGIASYLQDAVVLASSSTYSSTTLPWTWINTFQSRTGGSYGITQGTTTGTPPTRSKLISQDAGLLDSIIELSEGSPGFDWQLDTSRKWNEWHTQRGSDRGLVLAYGTNVRGFSWTESTAPGEIVSDVSVTGPPGTKITTATSSTARTTYGRREASLSFFADLETSTVTNGHLQTYADRAVADRDTPVIIPQLRLVETHPSVAWGNYWLGDTIRFYARIGEYQEVNAQYRIVQIDVDLDENDNESITLGLNIV